MRMERLIFEEDNQGAAMTLKLIMGKRSTRVTKPTASQVFDLGGISHTILPTEGKERRID